MEGSIEACHVEDLELYTSFGQACTCAGTVLGSVLGLLTPAAGFMAWLAVTYRYRLSKRKLFAAVVASVKVDDIADRAALRDQETAARIPRIVTRASRQLAAVGESRLILSSPKLMSFHRSAGSNSLVLVPKQHSHFTCRSPPCGHCIASMTQYTVRSLAYS